jgi:PAS domain S-box-containing protein
MEELEIFLNKIINLLNIENLDATSEKTFSILYDKIQKIKQENDMLNLALDNAADNFHVTDGKGNILRVNRAFEMHCKVSREFVEGKTVLDMERLGIYRPSMSSIAIKEKRQITYLQYVSGGEVITTATPILDEEGNVSYVVCNARYINDLQLLNKYYRDKSEREYTAKETTENIIGESSIMKSLKDLANQIAKADSSIVITGETGSGKSMLAKYIHQNSHRNKGRFIEINCAAIPESLIESELFGYSTGAFTGAKQGGKQGLIELANNGTLFLDEIGDMPQTVQAKLLNVLQKRVITRVGAEAEIPVNIRLISATNCDLKKMITEGKFRRELYYRINVIPLYMPPIRDRSEDIPLLIEHFRRKFCYDYKTNVMISNDALDRMKNYIWPGNIRELENLIERLVVTDRKGIIELEDLPVSLLVMTGSPEENITVNRIIPLKEAIEEVEKQLIISAFQTFKSSYKVADMLKISQSSAMRRIHKYK